MSQQAVQIVIIDDDPEMGTRPLFVKLVQKYEKENIIWKENPKEGISYIKEHLTKRTIVILDYHFGIKQTNGLTIFKDLQKESSLLYVILNTAREINDIPNSELKVFINDHLMALVDKTDGYKATLLQVEKAINYLDNRVDCILEEWIVRHERFKRTTPYLKDDKGESYTLREILSEIRRDTPLGKSMSSNIIRTAITLLQNEMNQTNYKK